MAKRTVSTLVSYLPRVLHVLRTEGLRVLLGKIRRRMSTTTFTATRPRLIRLFPPIEPLTFPCHGTAPVASIIIPAFNNYELSCHCLASLHALASEYPFEVILVDDCSTDETAKGFRRWPGLRVVVNPENLGFVGSCNRGAALARGEYLVFLNNDTQVQAGWLDALIETFRARSDAGLVGSHLIYPDGRQQEAGAIVFDDGSAWNYGHLDDPCKPQYSYLREPDYASGASLAIKRRLFDELGGFDARFAPAYYEDADIAFRARAAGCKVYFQPLSRVVHFEGASAGTDENATTGMKRYQAINRRKFLDRWRKELASHGARGEDLERQKERSVRRRVLVVDVYMLTPDKESGSLRMLNLFAILQELGFKVTFAAANLEAPEPYVSDLQKRGIEVLYRPYVKSIDSHLRVHGGGYDLVILSRADAAAQVLTPARRYCPSARIVFDTVDLHFLREIRLAELTGDKATRAMGERRKREELQLIARADTTLVVSPVERNLLSQAAPAADVRILSNIHQIYGSRKPFAQRRGIFFIGSFAHPPNTDAVLWFCREVLPMIRTGEPGICFSVIGADPPSQVSALASEHVRILGHVPDVTPFFDGCRLSVAPLRYGAGVKGKVNQSLAYGLPVVATTQAIEGMSLRDGESVLVADDPREVADAVLRLYCDQALWERLSRGGVAVMQADFSFAAARRALIDLVGA